MRNGIFNIHKNSVVSFRKKIIKSIVGSTEVSNPNIDFNNDGTWSLSYKFRPKSHCPNQEKNSSFDNVPLSDDIPSNVIEDGTWDGNNSKLALLKKADKSMPDFDLWEIANLIDFSHIYSKLDKPQWRKDLIKVHGACGINKVGYNDVTKAFMWEWDEKKLGRMYLDAECLIYFDGTNFMLRENGHPDDNRFARSSVSLTSILIDRLRERDSSLLDDVKWRNKNLWHEFIIMTQVCK